jgi:ADP-heptose:LPS heptosyltransferase
MKKILIIRFSSIGDIVLTSPVIRCVKQQLDAEIHFITKDIYQSILADNPHIDKLILFKDDINEVVESMKTEQYDFVVDLHHNLRSLRLKKNLKRPSSSFPKVNVQKFLLTNFKIDRMPEAHIVDRYFEATQQIGVVNDGNGLDYFIPENDRLDIKAYDIPEEYVAFAIGAQYATKRLPNEKIIEIIKGIKMPVVLLGGPSDEDNARFIQSKCDVIDLVGKININQSASVIQRAQKVISHDTGMMHIAVALKKQVISIWGNTTPNLGMYPYYPENRELFTIHEVDLQCRPCSKIGYQKCPKKHFNCMEQQDVEKIISTVNA